MFKSQRSFSIAYDSRFLAPTTSERLRTGIRYRSVYKKKQTTHRQLFVPTSWSAVVMHRKNHIAIVWKVQGHRFQRWKEKHVEELEALKRRDNTTGNNPSGDEKFQESITNMYRKSRPPSWRYRFQNYMETNVNPIYSFLLSYPILFSKFLIKLYIFLRRSLRTWTRNVNVRW